MRVLTTTADAAATSSARSDNNIAAPVQGLEHFRRREIQLVEHEPVAAAHRLRERAVITRDASNIARRGISAYISADGPTCASAPSWKATPPFSSGANDPTYSETSVCSWLLMRTNRWPVARASCDDDNSGALEKRYTHVVIRLSSDQNQIAIRSLNHEPRLLDQGCLPS